MLTKTIERLSFLLDTIPQLIANIPDDEFSKKPAPNKWSKKEILGHLADSAANNHQRFVRIPFEKIPVIVYDQDNWNKHNYHQLATKEHVLSFWEIYNRHILLVIQHIPEHELEMCGRTNEHEPFTLRWLIEDYVVHMEHHLKQIVSY